jgi:AcrR family transcriptional regulator
MVREVKRRAYDASGRQEQARAARARVLAAARARFLDEGYSATTVAAVAHDASVSVEFVYKAFRNKPGLLKGVFDVAIAGDDEPVPVMEREFVAAIEAEPEPARKLERYAEHLADAMPRIAAIQLLIKSVATVDPDIAEVWRTMQNERLAGMTAFAAHLQASGSLRDGVDAARARDLLWTYNAVEIYELVAIERGWDVARYRDFVAESLIAALATPRPEGGYQSSPT